MATPSDLYEFPNSRFVADFIGQVNLFEGALTVDEPDHAEVTSPALPARVWLDHGVSGAKAASVWLALRPEKITCTNAPTAPRRPRLDDAPAGCNLAAGVVRQITYLGSESVYDGELDGGRAGARPALQPHPLGPGRLRRRRTRLALLARLLAGRAAVVRLGPNLWPSIPPHSGEGGLIRALASRRVGNGEAREIPAKLRRSPP